MPSISIVIGAVDPLPKLESYAVSTVHEQTTPFHVPADSGEPVCTPAQISPSPDPAHVCSPACA